MKKILFHLSLLCALFAATSCFKTIDLDGTVWDVVSYEDMFDGSVVSGDYLNGFMKAYEGGNGVTLYLTIDEFGYNNDPVDPSDYKIVRSSSNELVIDLWYYEHEGIRVKDCTYEESYMGKKIYSFPDPQDSKYSYYVYFNSKGNAVDLGREEVSSSEYYYYDTTRIMCKRR